MAISDFFATIYEDLKEAMPLRHCKQDERVIRYTLGVASNPLGPGLVSRFPSEKVSVVNIAWLVLTLDNHPFVVRDGDRREQIVLSAGLDYRIADPRTYSIRTRDDDGYDFLGTKFSDAVVKTLLKTQADDLFAHPERVQKRIFNRMRKYEKEWGWEFGDVSFRGLGTPKYFHITGIPKPSDSTEL